VRCLPGWSSTPRRRFSSPRLTHVFVLRLARLFVIEGAATCVVSIGAYFLMPDYPSNTPWLTDDEKWLAAARLSADDVGSTDTKHDGHWASFKQCTTDWRTWLMVFNFMMVTGSQTIQYFIPTLMGNLGYKGTMVQYMTVPGAFPASLCLPPNLRADTLSLPLTVYCVAAVFIIVIPFSSDLRKERPIHISVSLGIAAVSFAVIMGCGSKALVAQYVFLCLCVASCLALLFSHPSADVLAPSLQCRRWHLRLRAPRSRLDVQRHLLAGREAGRHPGLRQRARQLCLDLRLLPLA
jgi:hypothetical protein